ncbi:hypothetical protein ACLI1A_03465 [Flavobacterium sp. RHBU_3]|uniref:hypothetical protein n=1 Tax=Flavobacterium sp. RHBU_3 TaxID=3391184 RepID=UPI0039848A56
MKKIMIFTALVIFYSCSTTNKISGKKYIYQSLNRELILSFENDTACTLKNIFYCDDIDIHYKEITIKTTYRKEKDIIILKNINCMENKCVFPPTIDILIQVSKNCDFLNIENREPKKIFDGRTYQSKYYEYGSVPNIDIDTLYVYKEQFTLVKKVGRGSIGFVFK